MKITFIGGGNMASALIGGLLAKGYAAADLRVVELLAEARERLALAYAVEAVADMRAGVAGAECLVLAVKPQQLHEVAGALAPLLGQQLVISIAAGIRTDDLSRWLGGYSNIVRVMPNTPALVRSGISGLFAMSAVSAGGRTGAAEILSAVGAIVWLAEEQLIDAITGVSGSGPAYVFYFIEALQQAACELGFSEHDARTLALGTFSGAVKLAEHDTADVATLRARVTSKNGTTERALGVLDSAQVKSTIVAAVHAAALRSKELGEEFGKPAPGPRS
jgi:pyrroline-5-carboxylate reductase